MKFRLAGALILLVCAATVSAAPIRVGIFKGVPSGRYWHKHVHPGSDALAAMLADPLAARLNFPPVPTRGFITSMYGVDKSCDSTGCVPSAGQIAALVAALDSLDVLILPSVSNLQSILTGTADQNKFLNFVHKKGTLALHNTADIYSWPALDTIVGARFDSHPRSERGATLHLEGSGGRGGLLNAGLPDSVRFSEEWFSFTIPGSAIRNRAFLQVHLTVDESSYDSGMGGARAMGDHPMSWSRELPEGGRFFYTALGHRTDTFDSVYFFRRQLYNAILWASKDTAWAVGIVPGEALRFSDASRISVTSSSLAVSILHDGPHAVEVRALDGRLVQARRGEGRVVHEFSDLHPRTVYAVSVSTEIGKRLTRLVMTP